MGVFSSGILAGPAKVALVVVAVGGLTAGAYFAYQTTQGDADSVSGETGPTVTASPTASQETLTPTAEPTTTPPTPSPTSEPTLPPTPTQPPTPTVDPACAERGHNHLNIDLLSADSGLVGAVISEIDEYSVRIEIEGAELVITGWGEDIGIGRRTSNIGADLMERVVNAIDAANFVC